MPDNSGGGPSFCSTGYGEGAAVVWNGSIHISVNGPAPHSSSAGAAADLHGDGMAITISAHPTSAGGPRLAKDQIRTKRPNKAKKKEEKKKEDREEKHAEPAAEGDKPSSE
jgi:hypothetical protein